MILNIKYFDVFASASDGKPKRIDESKKSIGDAKRAKSSNGSSWEAKTEEVIELLKRATQRKCEMDNVHNELVEFAKQIDSYRRKN